MCCYAAVSPCPPYTPLDLQQLCRGRDSCAQGYNIYTMGHNIFSMGYNIYTMGYNSCARGSVVPCAGEPGASTTAVMPVKDIVKLMLEKMASSSFFQLKVGAQPRRWAVVAASVSLPLPLMHASLHRQSGVGGRKRHRDKLNLRGHS